MMKKIVLLLLSISFVFISVEIGYADQSKVVWGMNHDEVQKAMGKKSTLVSETDKWSYALYENQKISKYKADLTFWYNDGRLYMKRYNYEKNKDLSGAYKNLSKELTKKYGNATLSSSNERQGLMKYCDVLIELFDHGLTSHEDRRDYISTYFNGVDSDVMLWDLDNEYVLLMYVDILPMFYTVRLCYIDKENYMK